MCFRWSERGVGKVESSPNRGEWVGSIVIMDSGKGWVVAQMSPVYHPKAALAVVG